MIIEQALIIKCDFCINKLRENEKTAGWAFLNDDQFAFDSIHICPACVAILKPALELLSNEKDKIGRIIQYFLRKKDEKE